MCITSLQLVSINEGGIRFQKKLCCISGNAKMDYPPQGQWSKLATVKDPKTMLIRLWLMMWLVAMLLPLKIQTVIG